MPLPAHAPVLVGQAGVAGQTNLTGAMLTKTDAHQGQFTLSGPSECLEAAHWPVRGDLADIRLAGRCFVPYYAVPMRHMVTATAPLRRLAHAQAEVLDELPAGQGFDVLDMSGGWCWGQVVDGGCVGYIRHDLLAVIA